MQMDSCTLFLSPPRKAGPTQPSARTRPETELRPQIYSEGTFSSHSTVSRQTCRAVSREKRPQPRRENRAEREGCRPSNKDPMREEIESEACPLAGVGFPRFGVGGVGLDPAQIQSTRIRWRLSAGVLVREESTHTPPRRGRKEKKGKERAQKHCNVRGHKRSDRAGHGTDQRR